MRLPIKLICRSNRLNSDGTCSVYVQYCCDQKNKPLLGTNIRIPSLFWNAKAGSISAQLPITYGSYKDLNNEMGRLKRIAEDIVTYAILKKVKDRSEFLKKYYSPYFDMSEIEIKEKEEVQAIEKKRKTS